MLAPHDDEPRASVCIEVTSSEPFRIKSASQQFLDLFEYSKDELAGRTLRMICGPETSVASLRKVITATACGKEASSPLCLYTSSGTKLLLSTQSKPDVSWTCCTLKMVLSDSLTVADAFAYEDHPCAIVSPERPHNIEQVNLAFNHEFEMDPSFLLRRQRLGILQGPRTNGALLASMLEDAGQGQSRGGELVVYTSECKEVRCEVLVKPVFSPSGVLSHLQVTFKPVLTTMNKLITIQSISDKAKQLADSNSSSSLHSTRSVSSDAEEAWSRSSSAVASSFEKKGVFLGFITSPPTSPICPNAKPPRLTATDEELHEDRRRRRSSAASYQDPASPPRQHRNPSGGSARKVDSTAVATDLSRLTADIPAGDPRIAELYSAAVRSLGGITFVKPRRKRQTLGEGLASATLGGA